MKKLFSKLMLVAMAAMTFAACEDVPEPYDVPGTGNNVPGTITEIEGGTGEGTVDDPFNTIAALNYGKKLASGEESADYYFIKGKVASIKEDYTAQYGNATFYISEDGTATNQFYAYRVLYLGNKKFSASDTPIKAGDDVIVCGKITNYNGTIETAQGKGFLYSPNGENRGGEPQPATPAADPTGEGTKESPFNVSAALNYTRSLAADVNSPTQVYIKGKISQISEEFGTQFGNATFYISDDGAMSNEFYIFRTKYLGNKSYTSGKTQIKVGDEVIICGNVVNFRGNTPETAQNASYLYSLNGVTEEGGNEQQGEPKGDGTLQNPFNATAANAFASSLAKDAKSDKDVYIKGKIIAIEDKNQFSTQYGNCTFYISDDGTDKGDKFYVFRTLYLGNVKYSGSGTLPKAGDEVIICGKVTNYMGNTPETAQNESYIYSLNGKTEGGGQQQETKVIGSIDEPVSTTDAVKVIEQLEDKGTTAEFYYVKGIVTSIKTSESDIAKYKNIDYYIADEPQSNYQLQVFRGKNLGNTDFTSADQLKVGDEVIVYGQLMKYKNDSGIIPEMAQGNYLVKRNGETSGNDENPQSGDNQGGTLEGNVLTVNAAEFGFANEKEATTSTLVDGTKVTFSKADGTSTPKYYAGDYASVRVYANNTVTIEGSKKIVSIVITTTAPGSGKKYNGGDDIYAQGSSKVDGVKGSDTNVTFSGLNDQKVTIVNVKDGSNTQLRISKMVITFAE